MSDEAIMGGMFRVATMAVLVALVIGGSGACGGAEPQAGPVAPSAPASAGGTSPAVPETRNVGGCFTDRDGAIFDYVRDGTTTSGIVVGTGAVGVVISYEAAGTVCSWVALTERLVGAGYAVLLYDRNNREAPEDDIVVMARRLHDAGTRTIFLVGGSMGGRLSPLAATRLDFPVAGVVNLAGVVLPEHAAALRAPLLQVYGANDRLAPTANMEAAHAAATNAPDRQLLAVPGTAHASALFETDQGPKVLDTILAFIAKNSR